MLRLWVKKLTVLLVQLRVIISNSSAEICCCLGTLGSVCVVFQFSALFKFSISFQYLICEYITSLVFFLLTQLSVLFTPFIVLIHQCYVVPLLLSVVTSLCLLNLLACLFSFSAVLYSTAYISLFWVIDCFCWICHPLLLAISYRRPVVSFLSRLQQFASPANSV